MTEETPTPENQDSSLELYHRYRPRKFSEVVGQPVACQLLQGHLRNRSVPHFMIFHGEGSGIGKTTLARIVGQYLVQPDPAKRGPNCPMDEQNYEEFDVASSRGIDFARTLQRKANWVPIGGGEDAVSVYVLDEFHGMTKDAFDALLKLLEEPPPYLYIMCCTTNLTKVPKTIQTRATLIALDPVGVEDVAAWVGQVAIRDGWSITQPVADAIAMSARGSVRTAMVLLNSIKAIRDAPEAQQLKLASAPIKETEAHTLAGALWDRKDWKVIRAMILKFPTGTEWESVRRVCLAWFASAMLNEPTPGKGGMLMACFEKPFYVGRPDLVMACALACVSK